MRNVVVMEVSWVERVIEIRGLVETEEECEEECDEESAVEEIEVEMV